MPVYEVALDEEGRLILPPEVAAWIGARAGRSLEVSADPAEGGVAPRLSLRVSPRPSVARPGRQDTAVEGDDLNAMKTIARAARAAGARPSTASDPIGDFLLAEDRRSRGL